MSDFLLELRCEEIPARMQAGARGDLEKLFRKEMDAAGVTLGEVTVWSTPRRLAVIARDLPIATAAVSEELKGPRVGAPPQALEGFLRKTGLSEDQLTVRDGVLFAVTEKPGRATADVLAEAIPAIVRAFPWPKSMRWGAASLSSESLRWVRPLSGIVAILGEDLVACEVGGIRSGYATRGHRFHCANEITIGSASDYAEKLRACHVIVDHEERQDLIRDKAVAAAHAAGLVMVADEGLVVENAGLTEWPVPLLGRFDEAYLDVPPEVIQLTARTNQKYFICREPTPEGAEEGKLANAFICTANIVANDGGTGVVDGNRKVLAARLSDARFFWEQDRRKTLSEHADGLSRITFHEKLGTVADKVERVAKLARWLVEEGIVGGATSAPNTVHPEPVEGSPSTSGAAAEEQSCASTGSAWAGLGLADQAELAARLCKADLVTEMVGEFPELQGLIGGYYAADEGLPAPVAEAIRDHYKPVGQGDDVPTAPVTVAVSLADKLDTIFQFFRINETPTGSKDPFALRRAALGAIAISVRNGLRWHIMFTGVAALTSTIIKARIAETTGPFIEMIEALSNVVTRDNASELMPAMGAVLKAVPKLDVPDEKGLMEVISVTATVRDFFLDRLEVMVRGDGVAPGLVRASMIIDGDRAREDDLVRLLARVHALQAFIGTEDGANLLAGYKRAANILKKEGVVPAQAGTTIALSYTPEPAEKALMDALSTAAPQAAKAVAGEDFAEAMAALATLRVPIDAFFDDVTVNDENKDKREARLGLLARFRDAVHSVADFSKIEG